MPVERRMDDKVYVDVVALYQKKEQARTVSCYLCHPQIHCMFLVKTMDRQQRKLGSNLIC